VSQHGRSCALFLEHETACDQPVGHAAQSVDIGPPVDRVAQGHFGSHVRRGARGSALDSHADFISVQHFDQPKIEHLREVMLIAHPAEKNVRRLDVPMNHAVTVSVA
jgi:hypothetical protein